MKKPLQLLYTHDRFPAEVIVLAVRLYFRFPRGLRMAEEQLSAGEIEVSHEAERLWVKKFGREFANRRRCCTP